MNKVYTDALKKSIDLHGTLIKQVVAMEEMAELIQQISKNIRGEMDREHLLEEYADVQICMEMLKMIYGFTDNEIERMECRKMERQILRDDKERSNRTVD